MFDTEKYLFDKEQSYACNIAAATSLRIAVRFEPVKSVGTRLREWICSGQIRFRVPMTMSNPLIDGAEA